MADDLGRDFTDREIRNIANETLREIETPVRNGRYYTSPLTYYLGTIYFVYK